MAESHYTVFALGFGNMASAMLAGADENPHIDSVQVIRQKADVDYPQEKLHAFATLEDAAAKVKTLEHADTIPVILLGVKPYHLSDEAFQAKALPFVEAVNVHWRQPPEVITMAALHRAAFYEDSYNVVPEHLSLVMPNTPIAAGLGTSLHYAPGAAEASLQRVTELFGTQSKIIHCETERAFSLLTPVVGCMPGFLFYMMQSADPKGWGEVLHEVVQGLMGSEVEFSREQADALVRQIVSFAVMRQEKGASLEVLTREVATPGGITEAGVNAMRESDARDVKAQLECAIKAALARDGISLP